MELNSKIKLTLPVDISYLDLIFSTVEYMCQRRGFLQKDINKIKIGAEEAVTNVIKHGYAESEDETFDMVFINDEVGIKIIIKEKGEPFDPELVEEYDSEKIDVDKPAKGLGLFLMKKVFDSVSFHNLGGEGKETHLVKNFPYKSIDAFKGFKKEIVETENKSADTEKKEKIKCTFNIRLMKEEEAIDVSKCAYSAYGYTYPNPDIYYPEKVREYNKSNKMISIVAVSDVNEIIGHTALKPDSFDNVAEVGVSFVKPKYRGIGCFNQLEQERIDEAVKRGFDGLYSQAVTTHPYSQKAAHKYGFKDCGLMLLRIPKIEFKKIQQDKVLRETLMLSFLYLKPPKKNVFYLPEKHFEIIDKIYKNMNIRPEYKKSKLKKNSLASKPSEIEVFTDMFGGVNIYINSYGEDIFDKIRQLKKNLCIDKYDVIFLILNLTDPFTAIAADEFEKMDFFFCGIMPGTENKTKLIFQFLNNQRIDYDTIKIDSEMGEEIKDYIKKSTGIYE
ncbi:GNAT family N-acetyltransferase [Candidatus Dependentiae bacterium]|nr:GNAT family N-acetyltransferase [Candidatus Dependentiae bacterium]